MHEEPEAPIPSPTEPAFPDGWAFMQAWAPGPTPWEARLCC